MTPKERAAMQQALEALETLDCGDSYKTHNAAAALRKALTERAECTLRTSDKPLHHYALVLRDLDKTVDGWCEEPEFYLDGERLYAAPVKQAEQEPVAWFVQYKNRHEFVFGNKPEFIIDGVVEPLYAAPVRTKDLTDDEIEALLMSADGIALCRAVIAADREKNK